MAVDQPAATAVMDTEAVVLVVMRRAAGRPTVGVPHYAFQSSKKVVMAQTARIWMKSKYRHLLHAKLSGPERSEPIAETLRPVPGAKW